MMKLEDINKNLDLLNDIDWEMTPEMAAGNGCNTLSGMG